MNVSARDLLTIPEVKAQFRNEVELINIVNDGVVKPFLHLLGIDINKPFGVFAANHRDMNNNTGIGYIYSGSPRIDRAWTQSKICDMTSRIAATAYSDVTLTKELVELSGNTVNFNNFSDGGEEVVWEKLPESQLNDCYKEDSTMLSTLSDIIIQLRGKIAL
jgi:hypothetical protein